MRRTVAGLAVGLALGLSLPASAAAWTQPVRLSPSGEDAHSGVLDMDIDGDAVAAWLRFDNSTPPPINPCCMRAQTRVRKADGTLGPVRVLSAAGQSAGSLDAGVADDGKAVFVWTRFDGTHHRVQLRTLAPDGTLSKVRTISPAGGNAQSANVAVAPDGTAAIYWRRFDGANFRAQARMLLADGTLSRVQNLSGTGFDVFVQPAAIAPDGGALFPWTRDGVLHVRARSAAGTLSPAQRVSALGDAAGDVDIAIDPFGQATIVWTRFVPSGDRVATAAAAPTFHTVQARRRTSAGALGSVLKLSPETTPAYDSNVAVDGDGGAFAVWRREVPGDTAGCCLRAEGRTITPAGTLDPRESLSPVDAVAGRPQVALEPDGDGVIGFTLLTSTGPHRVTLRTRSADGTLTPGERVSSKTQNADGLQVAVSPTGAATALWTLFTSDSQVQLTAGP